MLIRFDVGEGRYYYFFFLFLSSLFFFSLLFYVGYRVSYVDAGKYMETIRTF